MHESNSEDSEIEGDEPEDDDYDHDDEDVEGEPNLVLEDWVSWIKRTTEFAEEQLAKAKITDWVTEQRKRYWEFAGRLARCSDSRRSHLILHWIPKKGFRRVGSPEKRWSDDIATYCSKNLEEHWFVLAQDLKTWDSLKDKFVETSLF